MTLATAVFGHQTLVKKTGLALGGALFVAMAAQISIGWPVPMTLQTLAILVVGLSFGATPGAATLVTYLAMGALGLPVFANALNGVAFFGPTAGFLVGFVALAWVAGAASERWMANGVAGRISAMAALVVTLILAGALLYVPGLAWPMAVANVAGIDRTWVGQDFASYYWPYFMQPFLAGDALKTVLALVIVGGGLATLKPRKG